MINLQVWKYTSFFFFSPYDTNEKWIFIQQSKVKNITFSNNIRTKILKIKL